MLRKTIDRRVARSRAKLHDALLWLIAQRGYEAVTVRDICRRAAIGRSTFYAHYASKDDLMRGGFKLLRDTMAEPPSRASTQRGAKARGLAFSLAMFEHAHRHAHLHHALAGNRGGMIAREAIHAMISDTVRHEIGAMRKQSRDAMPRESLVQYIVGAFMGVVAWWLEGGAKLSPAQMDTLFQQLATEGLA